MSDKIEGSDNPIRLGFPIAALRTLLSSSSANASYREMQNLEPAIASLKGSDGPNPPTVVESKEA